MNIYEQKKVLKILLVLIALVIAALSLFYTNNLVNKLSEREQKLIDLYAKGLENVVNSDNSENISFLFKEIIEANTSVPVILTDQDGNPIGSKNIDIPAKYKEKKSQNEYLKTMLAEMKEQHEPIEVKYGEDFKNYIYYKNSDLLNRLKYYPYVQIAIISVFILLGYLVFSYSRKSEQNKVWVGMSKETAHQLGTPISSLMAWLEYIRSDKDTDPRIYIDELDKDIKRLHMIAERFSNIGSVPVLKTENINNSIRSVTEYLRKRISTKVNLHFDETENYEASFNAPLLEWVIENIVKNAVDAMNGVGEVKIVINALNSRQLSIDISDSGKGIPKSDWEKVFMPGFSTKKRGWGLGLTLAKRIIEEYHKGKVFVLSSDTNKGTTFRIVLNIT